LGLEVHRAAGHLEGVELADPPAGELDYLGLNYYRRDPVKALSDRPFDWTIDARPGTEQTEMGWEVAPDGLRDTLLWLHRDYAPPEIVVTENGAAYPDAVAADGRVHDEERTSYLARHLEAAAEAIEAGVPLRGYHVWSLLDNYEWSLGYTRRFGVIHVDYETQRRTPKASAEWYSKVIAAAR
ncbi:MAG TPA: family 1 glycosylhydrolase, partial [Candidatus Limnocylindrales bacterium]|nr:family 1 glycosylhydrolase [Candidatus Limnocylindrales bacterium]